MIVIDASAVLAATLNEVGADRLSEASVVRLISSVNACEVLTRLIDLGRNPTEALASLKRFDFAIASFDAAQAQATAALRMRTRHLGLSLGDRACLALALEQNAPVLTADRAWEKLDIGVEIRLIR